MTTTTRKQTPAQARKAALESDYTPLYAFAGLTKAVATSLQATWQETRDTAGKQIADWQSRSEQQAKTAAGELTTLVQALPVHVKTLPVHVKTLPETTRARLAELQKQAQEMVRSASVAYVDLAGRGKLVVDGTVVTARQFSDLAEKRAGDVLADVVDAVDPAFEKVQEGVTQARKTVTGRTATETMTPRSAVKASASRAANRSATEQRAATKKAATKNASTKKATVQKAAKKAATTRAVHAD